MKAFLSHSSRDKGVVEQVANQLGAAASIYDKESFEEGKKSAEEILRGLSISDLFVLFLSASALKSDFVKNEIAYALEKVFAGRIKSVLVFSLDGTSHRELPESLQVHTVEHTNKPAQIVRRIRSRLIELELQAGEHPPIFIGRERELRDLSRMLTRPPEEMASVVSIAGWQGLGRRTLAGRALNAVFPHLKREQPTVLLGENDGIEDFHRKLFDAAFGLSQTSASWQKAMSDFSSKSPEEKVGDLSGIVAQIVAAKEVLFILGDIALVQHSGDLQPYIASLVASLPKGPRPQMVLVHRRRLSPAQQAKHPRIFFTSVTSFGDDESAELLGAYFKQKDIAFTRDDLNDLVRFVGGHPENIRLATEYASKYGLEQLRREKSQYVDILVFQALEVIKRIRMAPLAQAICAALLDFQYLQIEDLVATMAGTDSEILEQLRTLEDHGIVERFGRHYRISPYLVEAITRSNIGEGQEGQRKLVGERLLSLLSEVGEFDHVSLSLINASALAAIRGGRHAALPQMVARMILPSHLLTIAREKYNASEYRDSARLAAEAVERGAQLTADAQVEALRLQAMSLLRLGERAEFELVHRKLAQFRSRPARRNGAFLLGFAARLDGNIDDAERYYRAAYKIDPRNFHVLRELATVLVAQGRYSEAEVFARSAYDLAPTNAFVIDIICEVIIGSSLPAQLQKDETLRSLLRELEALGTAQGRSFFNERMAQLLLKLGDRQEAWRHSGEAVRLSPKHLGPRFTRIRMGLQLKEMSKMDEDLDVIRGGAGSDGKASRFLMDRARIGIAIAKGDLAGAKELLAAALRLPMFVRRELETELRSAVRAAPRVEPELVRWANKQRPSGGGRRHSGSPRRGRAKR